MYADYKKKEKKLRQCTGQEKKGYTWKIVILTNLHIGYMGGGGED